LTLVAVREDVRAGDVPPDEADLLAPSPIDVKPHV